MIWLLLLACKDSSIVVETQEVEESLDLVLQIDNEVPDVVVEDLYEGSFVLTLFSFRSTHQLDVND